MIIRTLIIDELAKRGYRAEAQNTIKNGVELEGIRIMSESPIAPVIYTEELIKHAERDGKSLSDVVSAIINIYESNKTVDFNINELFDRDFILNHLYIGLQKESTEELVKRACAELEGIESYLYIRRERNEGDSYSVKLTRQLLERADISEVEAWEYAEAHTYAETTITSMAKVMCEMMNMEYSEDMEDMTPFYVLTNTSKVKGASAILNKKILSEFGKKYHTEKIVAIPSSVHEFLILPYTEEMNIDDFSNMVNKVNVSEVDPTEQLGTKAFIITF